METPCSSDSLLRFFPCTEILKQCVSIHVSLVFQIMEHCSRGSLSQELLRKGSTFPLMKLFDMATQIAKAMKYLELNGIVHADLCARSVYLASTGEVCTICKVSCLEWHLEINYNINVHCVMYFHFRFKQEPYWYCFSPCWGFRPIAFSCHAWQSAINKLSIRQYDSTPLCTYQLYVLHCVEFAMDNVHMDPGWSESFLVKSWSPTFCCMFYYVAP